MVAKSVIFIAVTVFLYCTGPIFEMIISNKMCAGLYGSYAYLLSTVYLIVLCFNKKGIKVCFIYLGIPLLFFAVVFFSPFWVCDLILQQKSSYCYYVLSQKNIYCFYIYFLTGLIAIILGEKSKREQI